MNEAYESIQHWTGLTAAAQARIVETLVVILVLIVLRDVAVRVLRRWTTEARVHYTWRKVISYTLAIIGLIAVARIWFAWFGNFGTFLGLASAGLAIALRDPIVNLVGWFFIVSRRPFSVGDRIQIGTTAGDVVDQRMFQFSLLEIGNWVQADQSTGRIVHVPNGLVFTQPQFNYTRGVSYIWNELRVVLTFESNWRKAKLLLQAIVERHAAELDDDARQRMVEAGRRYLIVYSSLTPIVYTDLRDNGVLLTMRYLADPRRRRGSANAIWEDVLDAFAAEDDIMFAYPTTRFFDSAVEGKAGLRPALPDADP
ncbi:MAG TPA: mechanosensitive ion channel family protein [Longimicrobiales bacterium]|nr:mechanosensitive ion channel family protein [Longimicrobiales bacterium]